MHLNVGREIAALQRLTVKQLRQKYAEVFGEDTNGYNKAWLVKRIAWRLQALAEGDLSQQARQWAAKRTSWPTTPTGDCRHSRPTPPRHAATHDDRQLAVQAG